MFLELILSVVQVNTCVYHICIYLNQVMCRG
ncbi:mCG141384 [Mus musculus]|nr:mCG141384 [Mus musculus]